MRFFVLLFFVLSSAQAQAQSRAGAIAAEDLAYLQQMEDSVGLLGHAAINDSLAENRFLACREMIPRLVKALKRPNSFSYPFEQLQSVSIQYPADSSFRVFTWQLTVSPGEYRFYGAIQLNTSDLQLFPLVDRSFEIEEEDASQAELTADKWYGALYYNIRQVEVAEQPYYLLFGFDGNTGIERRKLVEVLTFKDGKPAFGAPVFTDTTGTTHHRLMIEYLADASVSLNYDEVEQKIVFDHLMPIQNPYGDGMVGVPDGTYEAYELRDGRWHHISKLPTQILDEAPRPEGVLDTRSKSLFGKQRR